MSSYLLASTLTIYVGGLAMLVPSADNKSLEIHFLRGNTTFRHHKARVGPHQPYLVADPTMLDVKASHGYQAIGTPGLDQLIRFPLSDVMSLANAASADADVGGLLEGSGILAVGKAAAGVCCDHDLPQPLKDPIKWPVGAFLNLPGVTEIKGTGPSADVSFSGAKCPGQTVWELVTVTVALKATPAFKGSTFNAVFSETDETGKKREKWSAALWNLPTDTMHTHTEGDVKMASDHFQAYFSLLRNAKDECDCAIAHITPRTVKPVFCPPARAKRPSGSR